MYKSNSNEFVDFHVRINKILKSLPKLEVDMVPDGFGG